MNGGLAHAWLDELGTLEDCVQAILKFTFSCTHCCDQGRVRWTSFRWALGRRICESCLNRVRNEQRRRSALCCFNINETKRICLRTVQFNYIQSFHLTLDNSAEKQGFKKVNKNLQPRKSLPLSHAHPQPYSELCFMAAMAMFLWGEKSEYKVLYENTLLWTTFLK